MRCEQCGRDMNNAELWHLATDPKAPTSWSMKHLCWDCREHPERAEENVAQAETGEDGVMLAEALARNFAGYGNTPL
ncbi:MAG: hypothetical protein ACLQUY_06945 [Ktedonobacterales bacterium]